MSDEATGAVALGEVLAVVQSLRDLCARAMDNGQTDYAMLCDLSAESLESNVDSMGLADAADHD